MNRYLLNISYIGTHFRGVQKTIQKLNHGHGVINNTKDKSTIQEEIELALKEFNPINEINVIPSSRTDKGVHALHSTVHVDLERSNGQLYDLNSITLKLNYIFYKSNTLIRILSTELVPTTFSSRYNAKLRHYFYRFAISKADPELFTKSNYFHTFIPVEEINRCYYSNQNTFDLDKANEAANLFKGYHDLRSFMSTNKQNKEQDHPRFTLRYINDCYIIPGAPITTALNKELALASHNYWEIHISGQSFLYRQVRRMVAIILGYAQNKMQLKDVYEMITIPSRHSWRPNLNMMPPHGLYLAKIIYDENDKKFT